MIAPAVVSRRLQFCAGPGSYVFAACARHAAQLEQQWHKNRLFFSRDAWPLVPIDPDDEVSCDACRDEEGP